MPSCDNARIVREDLERSIFTFIDGDSDSEGDLSVLSSDSLEDFLTPLVITPPGSNTPNTESVTSVQGAPSDDDLIIPLYLFHVVERTSLNIEFNRCLQISLIPPFDNPECDSFSNSNYSSHIAGYNPEQVNMGFFIFWSGEMHDEYGDDFIIPYWLFAEPEEVVIEIPPYLFFEYDEDEYMEIETVQNLSDDQQYDEIENADIPDFMAGGDFTVTEDPLKQ